MSTRKPSGDGRYLRVVSEGSGETGGELIAEGCRLLADWLTLRAARLPREDASEVDVLVAQLLALAGP